MNIIYKIIPKLGNLVDENSDFIVNASNTALELGSGVSRAFFCKCGGNEFQKILYSLKSDNLKQGDVVRSISNAKNFDFALHACIMNYTKKSLPKNPTLDTIKMCLKNIENKLIEYAMIFKKDKISLALPLMGCGVGGLDKKEVLEIYKNFFINKIQENINLENIVFEIFIYGYKDEDFDLINRIFN